MKLGLRILLILILAILLVGCSKETGKEKRSDYESLLAGSWYAEGEDWAAFELYDDGTCKIAGARMYEMGTWGVVNGNLLKLTYADGTADVQPIYSLDKDCLRLGDEDYQKEYWSRPIEKKAAVEEDDRESAVINDRQICENVRLAILTAIMDPQVVSDFSKGVGAESTEVSPAKYDSIENLIAASNSQMFSDVIYDSLGIADDIKVDDYILGCCKTCSKESACIIEISKTSILVYLTNTDNSGMDGAYDLPSTSGESCIYAGPANVFGY